MSDDLKQRLTALEAENQKLAQEAKSSKKIASRALASYQQRALHMEIIRQQNEDLDRLAADLAQAKDTVEQRAKEVEQAARLKSEFLANFSHEIRTPLNGIIGYCDLLTREEGGRLTPHGRRDLGTIKSNAKTLLALINDILDLSKIESGHMEIVEEVVDLTKLVDECTATVREPLMGKDVIVTANIQERARQAFTDGLKLRQTLLNLLSNAAKFTDLGEIVVDAEAHGDTLILSVTDTGIGIPPDQLPHVFDKFRQVDGSRTRKAGGTGLGLAIVKELSHVLGGDIEVKSTVGRGTTFRITLPGTLNGERLHAAGKGQSSEVPLSLPPGTRVLIIDDDPLIHQLLRGALEEEAFEVLSASDGAEGLRLAKLHRPEVVVLDIHLPKLNGWGVLSNLKSDPELQDIEVVLISVEEQRARGFSLGAFDYLVKPIEPNVLMSTVARAVKPNTGQVLVVDDDASTRELVSRRLAAEGFSVLEAANGQEALKLAEETLPSLMVLDLMMPELDGFEVLSRAREKGWKFPVIILTGKELSRKEQDFLCDGLALTIRKGGTGLDKLVGEARSAVVRRRAKDATKLPRVLYVEDIEQNRDIVRRYLKGVFQLSEAEDGEIGIQRAQEEHPDLILMDLSLPRVDGWEATRRIKAQPDLAGIPIVALTAHAGREELDRALEMGCGTYLTKPVDCDQLITTIRAQLEEHPS